MFSVLSSIKWLTKLFSFNSKITKYDNTCITLIKKFEGCSLKVYKDQGGFSTVGWGHLCTTAEAIKYTKGITQAQADSLLVQDLNKAGAQIATRTNSPTQSQFNALVSFVFNIGVNELDKGTVIKKLNSGDLAATTNTMLEYDHVGKITSLGLQRRRKAEVYIFNGGTIQGLQQLNWYE